MLNTLSLAIGIPSTSILPTAVARSMVALPIRIGVDVADIPTTTTTIATTTSPAGIPHNLPQAGLLQRQILHRPARCGGNVPAELRSVASFHGRAAHVGDGQDVVTSGTFAYAAVRPAQAPAAQVGVGVGVGGATCQGGYGGHLGDGHVGRLGIVGPCRQGDHAGGAEAGGRRQFPAVVVVGVAAGVGFRRPIVVSTTSSNDPAARQGDQFVGGVCLEADGARAAVVGRVICIVLAVRRTKNRLRRHLAIAVSFLLVVLGGGVDQHVLLLRRRIHLPFGKVRGALHRALLLLPCASASASARRRARASAARLSNMLRRSALVGRMPRSPWRSRVEEQAELEFAAASAAAIGGAEVLLEELAGADPLATLPTEGMPPLLSLLVLLDLLALALPVLRGDDDDAELPLGLKVRLRRFGVRFLAGRFASSAAGEAAAYAAVPVAAAAAAALRFRLGVSAPVSAAVRTIVPFVQGLEKNEQGGMEAKRKCLQKL